MIQSLTENWFQIYSVYTSINHFKRQGMKLKEKVRVTARRLLKESDTLPPLVPLPLVKNGHALSLNLVPTIYGTMLLFACSSI